jgi:transcriptional regulator with XRE-family HTH domain
MKHDKNSVGQRIKERRAALGMSQRDLAAALGYSHHSTVARIETGQVDLSQSRLVQFAETLHTTPAWLMGWEKEPEDLADLAASILQNPELLARIEKILSLSAADQRAVWALVDALATKNG